MDIDDLTYGELKKIAAIFSSTNTQTQSSGRIEGDGRPVIVRCRDAGVHYGLLVAYEGRTVWLRDARRLWSWRAKSGLALSGVAVNGIVASESKIDTLVSEIVLLDACEIIDATPEAVKSILEA